MQQVAARQLRSLVQQWPGAPSPELLDVREPDEIGLARLELEGTPTHFIPMSEILARMHELKPEVPLLALCHHGVRSQQVGAFLERRGYTVINIEGGIDAWSRDVDPEVPRY